MIAIKELIHHYPLAEIHKHINALDGISFDIPSGQFIGILGPNGSGKSTLAKHLNGLLLPDAGAVLINGKDTTDAAQLPKIREEVGMIFQNPDNQIIGSSVEEDVAFGPESRNLPALEIQERVENALKMVNLLDKRKLSPQRLSGGEKQRLAIAGVLASMPSCLVLDEPTSMLDAKGRAELLQVITRLNQDFGITIIMVTHHTDEVVNADYVYLMDQGRVVHMGTPLVVFNDMPLLKRTNLAAPQVIKLAHQLRAAGVALNADILTASQFVASFMTYFQTLTNNRIVLENCPVIKEKNHSHPAVILAVDKISFSYALGTINEARIINDISLTVAEGEMLGVAGSSGSGKTTLMKLLNGLLTADKGTITYRGENIYGKHYNRAQLRKEVGLVFQYPEHQLFCNTVLDEVCFGQTNMGMMRAAAEKIARETLNLVGIGEDYESRNPLELSGGEKKRVSIASILAMQPKVLILDEPGAGLDAQAKAELFQVLKRLQAEKGTAVIMVSHSMAEIAEHADRVLVLEAGVIALSGTPSAVFMNKERLQEIGIGIPQITEVTYALIKKGLPLPYPSLTVDQAGAELVSLLNEARRTV